jgi:hypothetical protein
MGIPTKKVVQSIHVATADRGGDSDRKGIIRIEAQ